MHMALAAGARDGLRLERQHREVIGEPPAAEDGIEAGGKQRRLLHGAVERIGLPGSTLTVNSAHDIRPTQVQWSARADPVAQLLKWLEASDWFASIGAVGHRVVHGMSHARPEKITAKLIARLREIVPYDSEHLPREIQLIEAFVARYPHLPQLACFDTSFHAGMPQVAKRLSLPRRYASRGVRRYGFHGLSYSYLAQELRRLDVRGARGKVILAHLGNGASLAALRSGKPVDTTMGFTPASGLVMGTRSGDLDPGLPYYLARVAGLSAAQFQRMVNHESGLRGISGTSADMRDLCGRAKRDRRAAEAIELFCYQVVKAVGAFTAVLGGLDTLVFSAGIGEHSPEIRARICRGLAFAGVRLDGARNRRNAPLISTASSAVKVRVIRTDEELMIARAVAAITKQR